MEFHLEQAREILGRTPPALNSLLRHLPDQWVLHNEGPDSWSVYDIVGHLIHGEETDWIPRAEIILRDGEGGTFEPFDRFAMFEKSRGKSLGELLDQFERLRVESLNKLGEMSLTPETLKKRGRHPDLGVVTLEELFSTWVVHDLGHIAQIVRVMARQYEDAVGPWKAYLSILRR
ncbi:MAG: DinB family protein [Blastocatellia bacterium]